MLKAFNSSAIIESFIFHLLLLTVEKYIVDKYSSVRNTVKDYVIYPGIVEFN